MTPLPKRRWSTRRQGTKRATIMANSTNRIKCQNCGGLYVSHRACPTCGFYKGKQVIKIRVKKEKKTEVEN